MGGLGSRRGSGVTVLCIVWTLLRWVVEVSAVLAWGRGSHSEFVTSVGSMVSIASEAFVTNAHISVFFRILDWDSIFMIVNRVEIIIKILQQLFPIASFPVI